ncbi:MAG: MBL fold metallo-hydrolase [Anaerolineae bacterium]|nr:MBL fold metallo-hydrolase [Anaerolineae bacterium]
MEKIHTPYLEILDRIQWLGHGSFRIQGPPLIYINPWTVTSGPFLADAVLVGHDHYDHCSPGDIAKLVGPESVIITNALAADFLPEYGSVKVLRPWQSINVDRASIKAVPAYTPHSAVHAREAGGLGFVISLDSYDIYYAGDTGLIPEVEKIHADIVMVPIDGRNTMSPKTAAAMVNRIRPRYAIPYNWGNPNVGASKGDALEFRAACAPPTEAAILPVSR